MKSRVAEHAFTLAKTSLGDLLVGLAFGKFSSVLPVRKVRETDMALAFWHPKPFWDEHILIVPKKHIRNISSLSQDDLRYVTEVYALAKEVVRELEWDTTEYSITTNGGTRQEVNQLHFHLHGKSPTANSHRKM